MKAEAPLPLIWTKAAILGTLWAASEIVFGSFLHNLRIPFSGNILAGIGIILMVSASYIWPGRGLLWRAGLICALMKTLSPSAVIFGPMLAIFSQALLMEASTRLLGRNMAGFLAGAALALSWNLFQKIFNLWLFYGNNIIALYTSLLEYARKITGISSPITWWPLLFLLLLYLAMGLVAGMLGMRTGKRLLQQPARWIPVPGAPEASGFSGGSFNHSVTWLLASILLMIISLLLVSRGSPWLWAPWFTLVITLWATRYKRACRQLFKPRLWLSFIIITMLAALVFHHLDPRGLSLAQALMTGFQMNARAVILVMGFAVLGTELYNPVLRNWLVSSYLRQLPQALDLAIENLPAMMAATPSLKSILRDPVAVFYQLLAQARQRLGQITSTQPPNKVIILTAARDEGKTTFARQLAARLSENHQPVQGILSIKVWQEHQLVGYDTQCIVSGQREPFLRTWPDGTPQKIGRFHLFSKGLQHGNNTLEQAGDNTPKTVIIDEVGRLETNGSGWAAAIEQLLENPAICLVLVANQRSLEDIISKWKLHHARIINISETSPEEVMRQFDNVRM